VRQHRKRLTDAEKWHNPWFRKLSVEAKLLWLYLLDNCDNAGVIEVDYDAVSFHSRAKITGEHLKELEKNVEQISATKLWIKEFISFQFGSLTSKSAVHQSVIRLIQTHQINYPLPCHVDAFQNPFASPIDKEKDKEKDFEVFYKAYPKKAARPKALESFKRARDKVSLQVMLEAIEKQKKSSQWLADGGRYIPNPTTWLNQERWSDEIKPKSVNFMPDTRVIQ
jgi:hypothetical protein